MEFQAAQSRVASQRSFESWLIGSEPGKKEKSESEPMTEDLKMDQIISRAPAAKPINYDDEIASHELATKQKYQDTGIASWYLKAYAGRLKLSSLASYIIARREQRCIATTAGKALEAKSAMRNAIR
ncbi:hypothetical protein LB543_24430 [Mesorhizobium sp. ESP7-2]|uniref:hypothetical protein n=1 Tax=Mesorhizobium sp. ESP7-2 TaxID=2876622 RepID=UPI001CCFC908|nr:hypothetical protein [Mesorhizobium sp. ESP7-2]MBZ9709856.1 hypothetical protein [Mesorhizobium sp. ESP7-2]